MNYIERINQIDKLFNEISLRSNEEYERTVEVYKNSLYNSEYKKLLYNGLIQHFSLIALKEIKNIYLGLYFREKSIKLEEELSGHFFNRVYFERNIIFHINVVINRIATLLNIRYLKITDKHSINFDRIFNKIKKEDEFKKSNIKDNVMKISGDKYLNKIIDIRNNLEHGLDPYFFDSGIIKSFDTNKILKIIKVMFETIKTIYDEHVKYTPDLTNIDIESLKMKRNENVFIGLRKDEDIGEKVQMFINESQKFIKTICNYTDKVSPFLKSLHIDEKSHSITKLIFGMTTDITFKYSNAVKSYMYGIDIYSKELVTLEPELTRIVYENNFDYFINMSYILLYSIYDKIGYLFSRIYSTPKDKTYFKNIVSWILSEENNFKDIFDIEQKLENLIESDYYKMLDRVRQNFIHGYDYMIQQNEGIVLNYPYILLLLNYNIEMITEFLNYLLHCYIPMEVSYNLSIANNLNYKELLVEIINLIYSKNPYINEEKNIRFDM